MAQISIEIKQVVRINVTDATFRQCDNDLTETVEAFISECEIGEIEPNIPGIEILETELESYKIVRADMSDADIPAY
jgi:hypothetical protein